MIASAYHLDGFHATAPGAGIQKGSVVSLSWWDRVQSSEKPSSRQLEWAWMCEEVKYRRGGSCIESKLWRAARGPLQAFSWVLMCMFFLFLCLLLFRAAPLTHWVRPGVEPATSWFLVRFISGVSQQELLIFTFYKELSEISRWKNSWSLQKAGNSSYSP